MPSHPRHHRLSLLPEHLIVIVGALIASGAMLLALAAMAAPARADGLDDLRAKIHERIIKLKNGAEKRVIFGRIANKLDRSQVRLVKRAAGALPGKTVWQIGPILDQGSEGSCVGHGCAAGLNATPTSATPPVDHAYALQVIYYGAQKRDPWSGGAYPGAWPRYEGSTVQAGIQELIDLGWTDSAEYAPNVDLMLAAMATTGPCILGTDWYDGMSAPDAQGYIHPTGSVSGGHCYLAYAYELDSTGDQPVALTTGTGVSQPDGTLYLQNSWGEDWGDRGTAKIRISEFRKVFDHGDAEAAFLTAKHPTVDTPAAPSFWQRLAAWFSSPFGGRP